MQLTCETHFLVQKEDKVYTSTIQFIIEGKTFEATEAIFNPFNVIQYDIDQFPENAANLTYSEENEEFSITLFSEDGNSLTETYSATELLNFIDGDYIVGCKMVKEK